MSSTLSRLGLFNRQQIPVWVCYLIVGATCAVVSNILLIAVVALGYSYLSGAFIICVPMLVIGYALHVSITFKVKPTIGAFLRYSAALLASYPIWIACLFLLCDILHLPIFIAGPISTVALFIWNYVFTHWAITRTLNPFLHGLGDRNYGAPKRHPTSKPFRIAFVCDTVLPWHKGGRERKLFEITKRLRRPGREVHVYTMNWWNGPRRIEIDGIYYHALCGCHPLYKDGRRSITQAIIFSLGIFKMLFEQFDVLDVDHMPFFPLYSARIVAWLKGQQLTASWNEVWGHDYWQHYLPGMAGRVGALMEKISFALPDSIISISPHTTKALRANGVRCRIETISMCVDLQAIAAVPPAEIESDIIYVGRLLEHKRVDLLIEAAALLKRHRPQIRVLIVGTGPEDSKIFGLIHALDLDENVILLGKVDDDNRPYALMKSSKLLVLPSVREGFGLVVLEALAAGIPVVTTSHQNNAAKELVEDKINGCIADANAKDLSEKIEYILDRPDQMKPCEGIEQYDWSAAARCYETLFEEKMAAAANRIPSPFFK